MKFAVKENWSISIGSFRLNLFSGLGTKLFSGENYTWDFLKMFCIVDVKSAVFLENMVRTFSFPCLLLHPFCQDFYISVSKTGCTSLYSRSWTEDFIERWDLKCLLKFNLHWSWFCSCSPTTHTFHISVVAYSWIPSHLLLPSQSFHFLSLLHWFRTYINHGKQLCS